MLNNIKKKIMTLISLAVLAGGLGLILRKIFHKGFCCGKANVEDFTGNSFSAEKSGKPVNINIADVQELANIPYVSLPVARNIVNYREFNGAFTVIEDLLNVKGIGPKLLELIDEYICAE